MPTDPAVEALAEAPKCPACRDAAHSGLAVRVTERTGRLDTNACPCGLQLGHPDECQP